MKTEPVTTQTKLLVLIGGAAMAALIGCYTMSTNVTLELEEVARLNLPGVDEAVIGGVLIAEREYWSLSPEDQKGKIRFRGPLTDLFPMDTIGQTVVVMNQKEKVYSDVYSVTTPEEDFSITLPQLVTFLVDDANAGSPSRFEEEVDKAAENGAVDGNMLMAAIMAEGDRQTHDSARALLYGNDFGNVTAFIKDKDGVLRQVEISWDFAGGGWGIYLRDETSFGAIGPGARFIFGT